MSSFYKVQICEVVGIYILHKLGEKYGTEKIGFYKDHGSACFENTSRSEAETIRKAFIKFLKN